MNGCHAMRRLGFSSRFVGLGFMLATSIVSGQEMIRYVHTDALGSPVAESDEAGNIVARYDYEPYGGAIGDGPQDAPGFTGHVSDSATGLTYMQQRYYDPDLAAFMSVDPVTAFSDPVGMFNRYRYANGSPYSFVDPDGRRACGQDTTCRLAQGESGSVLKSGSGELKERSPAEASKVAGKAAAEATVRTAGLRSREFKSAGAAARAWFDAVLPVAAKYTAEIGVRIFEGFDRGAILGTSVSDGMVKSILYPTLITSVSNLGSSYPAIGYAHTHPGTDSFSDADTKIAGVMYRASNGGRTRTVDVQAFVGLSDGTMYGWSVEGNKGREPTEYEYTYP